MEKLLALKKVYHTVAVIQQIHSGEFVLRIEDVNDVSLVLTIWFSAYLQDGDSFQKQGIPKSQNICWWNFSGQML